MTHPLLSAATIGRLRRRLLALPVALLGLLPLASRAQFGPATSFAASSGVNALEHLETPDVNGDGKPDMVYLMNTGFNRFGVRLNTTATGATTPTYGAEVAFTASTNIVAFSLTVADINADGKPDVVLPRFDGQVHVFRNTTATNATTPTFAASVQVAAFQTSSSSLFAVTTTDVNGDGKPDLVVGSLATSGSTNNEVGVALNTTAAGATTLTFGTGVKFVAAASGAQIQDVTAADVNGDGKPDLLTANYGNNTASVLLNTTAAGATTPAFGIYTAYSTGTGSVPYGVSTGDINADGKPDMLVANSGTSNLAVFLNGTAAGATTPLFPATPTLFAAGGEIGNLAVADVNFDGKVDVLTAVNSTARLGVFRNTTAQGATTPSFAAIDVYNAGNNSTPYDVAVADVNGDGKPDALVTNPNGPNVVVLLNQYTLPTPTLTSLNPTSGSVGASVVLTGTNFTGATAVSFNGTAATAFTVNSATQITATVPTGATTGSVTVTTPYGTTGGVSFTVTTPAPTITSLAPTSGPVGTVVTLTGTSFTGATTVRIGPSAFQFDMAFTVVNATTITATVPNGFPYRGAQNIIVTTPGGASNAASFTVTAAPSVTTAAASGIGATSATLGGEVISDVGSGITERGVVYVQGTGTPTTSNTKITAPGTTGTFNVSATGLTPNTQYTVRAYATNGVGTGYGSAVSFTTTVAVPVLTSIAPASGSVGSSVTLNGTDLQNITSVRFAGSNNNVVTTGYSINSAGTQIINIIVPAGAATGDVRVSYTSAATTLYSNAVTYTVTLAATPAPRVITPVDGFSLSNPTPTYSGTAVPGSTVTVYVDGSSIGTTTADGNATWSKAQPTALAPGSHSVYATAQSSGQTVSPNSNTNNFTVTAAPTVTTAAATGIGTSSATLGGDVTSDGGDAIIERGVVYVQGTGTPTISNTKLTATGTTGSFTIGATGLTASTQYTVRAYATNGTGTSYGSTQTFTTTAAAPTSLTISTGTADSPVSIAAGTYSTITVTGTGNAQLGGAVVVSGAFEVQNGGSLSTSCQSLTGSGSFTLAAGATLVVCDAAGLSSSGATGAVQVTGTRSFAPDASYVYNGAGAQATGAGLPAQVRNLTVSKASGSLTLSQPLAVRQVLTVAGAGGLLTNGQPLTLLSDATGTALLANTGTGQVAGSVTVQRYLDPSQNPGLGYRHLAVPTQGQTVASFGSGGQALTVNAAYNASATPTLTTPFPTIFRYDQSRLASSPATTLSAFDKGWVSPASLTETAQLAFEGYTVQLPGASTLSFTGALAQTQSTIPLARNSGPTAADAGWNFIGNPYASLLDMSTVTAGQRQNMDAAVYVYESTGQYAGQYRSYANGFGNPLVGTAQAFFVRVSSGQISGSLTLNNANRVTTYAQQQPVRRDQRPQLQLTLTGAGVADELTVYAETGATDAADAAFDALKLANPHGLNLATLTSTAQELAIDGRPAFTSGQVLPLAVRAPRAGSYTFAAATVANLPAGLDATLVDLTTGTRTPLTTGASYTAQLPTGAITGRFQLELGSRVTASPAAQLARQVSLYPNPTTGHITLLRPAAWGAATVQVLNSVGQVVLQRPLAATDTQLDLRPLPAGVYQLRLTTSAGTATKRLVRQ